MHARRLPDMKIPKGRVKTQDGDDKMWGLNSQIIIFFKGSMKTIYKFKMLIYFPCLLSFSQFSKSQLLSEFKHFSAGAFMTRQYRFIDF